MVIRVSKREIAWQNAVARALANQAAALDELHERIRTVELEQPLSPERQAERDRMIKQWINARDRLSDP
jgi:hypothetical protein